VDLPSSRHVAGGGAPGPDVPGPLRTAGALVITEGLALALLGAGYAVSGVVGRPEDRLATVLAGAFALLVGAGLVQVGRGLRQGRAWSLAPTVVVQVFTFVVGVGLLQGGVLWAALPLLGLPAAVLLLLAAPASRDVFRGAA
jgi:hypothetical protein